jgi:hypothetical protein
MVECVGDGVEQQNGGCVYIQLILDVGENDIKRDV